MEIVEKYKQEYKDLYYDSLCYDIMQLGSLEGYKLSEGNAASIYSSMLNMKAVILLQNVGNRPQESVVS
jgi:hypothetical protein